MALLYTWNTYFAIFSVSRKRTYNLLPLQWRYVRSYVNNFTVLWPRLCPIAATMGGSSKNLNNSVFLSFKYDDDTLQASLIQVSDFVLKTLTCVLYRGSNIELSLKLRLELTNVNIVVTYGYYKRSSTHTNDCIDQWEHRQTSIDCKVSYITSRLSAILAICLSIEPHDRF